MFQTKEDAMAGGLMSYAPSDIEQFRRTLGRPDVVRNPNLATNGRYPLAVWKYDTSS